MSANRYQDDQITRLALLEQSFGEISKSLIRIENKMDEGFKEIKENHVRLESKVDSNFKWVISSVLITFGGSAVASILTITAKMLHHIT